MCAGVLCVATCGGPVRVRDSGLVGLKTDPLMDPLRKEPRR